MTTQFIPPTIPSADRQVPPPCPRRLLNDRAYLQHADDADEAPMTASAKMRLRFANERPIIVNDAGMVRPSRLAGEQM